MSPSLHLLVLAIALAWLSPVLCQSPANVTWSQTQIDVARRGVACTAARFYNETGQYGTSSSYMFYTGGRTATAYSNAQYVEDAVLWTWYSSPDPEGYWYPREAHFLHEANYGGGTAPATLVMGAGRNQDTTLFFDTLYLSQTTGEWVESASTQDPPPPPMGQISWNWTTTPWVDTLYNDNYVMVLYGGWVLEETAPYNGYFDNHFYIAESKSDVQSVNTITNGVASPWSLARLGISMAGFNGSGTHWSRGPLIAMGGWEQETYTWYNDVWVASTARPGGSWTRLTDAAPWVPRFGAETYDSGRLGIFMYGGVTLAQVWTYELWYAQFPTSGISNPTWYQVPQTGGGMGHQPGCAMAYWEDTWTLYLVMMSAKADDLFNVVGNPAYTPPTIVVVHGLVKWNDPYPQY